MHWNPVKNDLASWPGEWRWLSYSNYSAERPQLDQCPIQVDYVHLPS